MGVRLSQCEVEGYLILPVVCGAAESPAAAMTDRTDVAVSGSLDVPLAAGSAVLFHRLGPGAAMSYA